MELIRRIVKLFSLISVFTTRQHYIDKLEMIDVDSGALRYFETEYIKVKLNTCKRSHSLTFYILRSFYASRLQDLFDVTQHFDTVTTLKISMFARGGILTRRRILPRPVEDVAVWNGFLQANDVVGAW
jgi:hypothetical protein